MRVLDAESVPDEGGYWLTVYALKQSQNSFGTWFDFPVTKVIATESNGTMHAIAEVFIEVSLGIFSIFFSVHHLWLQFFFFFVSKMSCSAYRSFIRLLSSP